MRNELLDSIITELEEMIIFLRKRIEIIDEQLTQLFLIEIEKIEKIKKSLEILQRTLNPNKNDSGI